MGFLPWEIQVAFPREIQLQQLRYPNYHACWVCVCFHNPPNSDVDYGIFNVRTDVNAFNCTRGCTDIVEESALKFDSRRKISCHTRELNLHRQHASPMLQPTELHPRPPWCKFVSGQNMQRQKDFFHRYIYCSKKEQKKKNPYKMVTKSKEWHSK